jgi:3-hydroxyisobutyrate dehydrogenase-like beta-hydroxyacid dehydrogenase
MAKNLLKAGYALTVYDKFAKCDDLVALGAKAGVSCKYVAVHFEPPEL